MPNMALDMTLDPPVIRGVRIDLSTGHVAHEELPAEVRRTVLGGRGLATHLLLGGRAYEADPLDPSNLLVFAVGPLTATGAPATARYTLASHSPLTGTIFEGTSGGGFGPALRRLGFDYLVVCGACAEPSYVHIDERGVRLLPAGQFWGLEVPDALEGLRRIHDRCEAAVIGPAGERKVLFASVATKGGRHVGRGGLGAVMGAKHLKAVVLESPDGAARAFARNIESEPVVSEVRDLLRNNPVTRRSLPEFGTSILLNVLNELGALPTRNFRDSRFELAEQISGEALRGAFAEKQVPCEGCFVGCIRRTRSSAGDGRGPEYESLWALGADCGIGDLEAVVEANQLCNRLGLDTISMGATLACAMELTEEGALSDGPRFGDAKALLELVPATAYRRGLGDELAEGSMRLAARHGRPELAMEVKGLELPAFDPRGMIGQGLALATSNRGACHLHASMLGYEVLGVPRLIDRFSTDGKAGLLVHLQNLNAVLDSLPHCKFAAHVLNESHLARMLSAVLGEGMEPEELLRAGERIWNLERLFNMRAGFNREGDTLPERLLKEPVGEGPSKGHVVDLTPMLDEYYSLRGWDESGRPTPGTLVGLGVEGVFGDVTSMVTGGCSAEGAESSSKSPGGDRP